MLARVISRLVLVSSSGLLVSELKVLAALEGELRLGLADLALEPEHDLLGSLRLLVEDGLRLTSESHLLHVVAALSLSKVGRLSSLVLGDLVVSVLAALLALAKRLALLGHVHHFSLSSV